MVTSGGGLARYAGLISGTSTTSSGTATLGFLNVSGTPITTAVAGFDLRTQIAANPSGTTTLAISNLEVVPEPATYAMLMAGGVAALMGRRRRARRVACPGARHSLQA